MKLFDEIAKEGIIVRPELIICDDIEKDEPMTPERKKSMAKIFESNYGQKRPAKTQRDAGILGYELQLHDHTLELEKFFKPVKEAFDQLSTKSKLQAIFYKITVAGKFPIQVI